MSPRASWSQPPVLQPDGTLIPAWVIDRERRDRDERNCGLYRCARCEWPVIESFAGGRRQRVPVTACLVCGATLCTKCRWLVCPDHEEAKYLEEIENAEAN